MDRFNRHAGVLQLIGVGPPQIQLPMSAAIFREPAGGIRRHPKKRRTDAVIDLIAAGTDARTDCRDEIARGHAKIGDRLDGRRRDACARSTPSGVNRGNHAMFQVGDQDGHAIGDPHGNRAGGIARDDGVGIREVHHGVAGFDDEDGASMDLFDADNLVRPNAQTHRQPSIIVVARRAPELELTRREHVRRVGNQPLGLKDPAGGVVGPAECCGNSGRHFIRGSRGDRPLQ